MTSLELDRELRRALAQATRDNVLATCAAIVNLGFSPQVAIDIVTRVILERERAHV